MLKNKTIKQFWKDTEAISPIIATILVLAVAVAAGVGLYFWFDTFQASAQEQVGESSTASMNIMMESSLGDELLKVVLPIKLFEYRAEGVDADNDDLIYRPTSSGNYSDYTLKKYGYVKYVNNWRDERFIQEIPIYIENRGPNTLTGVTIKYTQFASTLNYLLQIDRENNNQLLDVNGNPVHVELNDMGVHDNSSISYYFNEPSYAMDYSSVGSDAYLPIESSLFKDDRITATKLYDVDGNTRYAIADIGGVKTGWNTAGSLFASKSYGGLNATLYGWAKEELHNPTYEVGTLEPGENKKIYTYYYVAYLKPEYCTTGDSFADATVDLPIRVSCDQGMSQTVIAQLHLIDKDTT